MATTAGGAAVAGEGGASSLGPTAAAGPDKRLVKARRLGSRAWREARKRSTVRMKALRGEPALRWPKWAAAKRIRKPSTQKPDMALSHQPQQEEGSQPSTKRFCQMSVPSGPKTSMSTRRPMQCEGESFWMLRQQRAGR